MRIMSYRVHFTIAVGSDYYRVPLRLPQHINVRPPRVIPWHEIVNPATQQG